jgi:hypothetical protein
MYYINCHAHTRNSDGSNCMADMAERAYELGHCAFVVTDHDDVKSAAYQRNLREYELLLKYAPPKVPVIIGSEITTPIGEYLLFGGPAIARWVTHKDDLRDLGKRGDLNLYAHAFSHLVLKKRTVTWFRGLLVTTSYVENAYALIKCHPDQFAEEIRLIPQEWWDLVHGFEIRNGLQDFSVMKPDDIQAYRDVMPGALEIENSDAHSVENMGQAWNTVPNLIENEGQLIKWLRSGRKRARLEAQSKKAHTP